MPRGSWWLSLTWAVGLGCQVEPAKSARIDADGDGYPRPEGSLGDGSAGLGDAGLGDDAAADEEDCDDADNTVSPGAIEICNGRDDDCDGGLDEGVSAVIYADADADGVGAGEPERGCVGPGKSTIDGDCDDGDPAVYPGAPDPPEDGEDQDCDGRDAWIDADEDGVPAGPDCDDADAGRYPGADEICDGLDQDCDRLIDDGPPASVFALDADGDGQGDPANAENVCTNPDPLRYVANTDDCDDADPSIFVGQTETCDGVDQDCDGLVDEDASDAGTWYPDADLDGYGEGSAYSICGEPEGFVGNGNDCDDTRSDIYAGADERCDGVDQDCDGLIDDDASDAQTDYTDGDGDGDGDPASARLSCTPGPVRSGGDCDDADPTVFVGQLETCDGVDQDCDGRIDDDALDALLWYADDDGDAAGDDAETTLVCTAPAGFVATGGDCDDGDRDIGPNEAEVCNTRDDDCDGVVDEADADDAGSFYADLDADGVGSGAVVRACEVPAGHVEQNGDCDDADPNIHPGESERCDGLDQDCDGELDEDAVDAVAGYDDLDADGFGDPDSVTEGCTLDVGDALVGGDCDDSRDDVYPGAAERCDGADDDDCDGLIDEPEAVDAVAWYPDLDEDGYGDPLGFTLACSAPPLSATDNTDCDDRSARVHPGASEICDAADTDEDCDGLADDNSAIGTGTWYDDADSDTWGDDSTAVTGCGAPGQANLGGDCDDNDGDVSPGADERCGGGDEDCDGLIDIAATDALIWRVDLDGDGFGGGSTLELCTEPAGYVADGGPIDCDDNAPDTWPGAPETCDLSDEDCDGVIDNDALDLTTWYVDADSDGAGDPAVSSLGCVAPSGFVAEPSDCDDADPTIYPAASERSGDGIDNNCDGLSSLIGELTEIDARLRLDGPAARDGVGQLTEAAGDVDGDGYADVWVGAEVSDQAWLVYGGPALGSGTLGTAAGHVYFSGADSLGVSCVGEVDLDADGLGELVMGVPYDDEGGTRGATGINAGGAWLYFGADLSRGRSLGRADAVRVLGIDGWAGWSVGMLPNEAGREDLVLGAFVYTPTATASDPFPSNRGAVYLLGGDDLASLAPGDTVMADSGVVFLGDVRSDSAERPDQLGIAVGSAGDLTGDGVAELALAEYNSSVVQSQDGAVLLVERAAALAAGSYDANSVSTWRLYGTDVWGAAGTYLKAAGDVEADGYDDLLIGAPQVDDTTLPTTPDDVGVVWLVSGAALSGSGDVPLSDVATRFLGTDGSNSAFRIGESFDGGSDLDGDGRDDMIFGRYKLRDAFLFYGRSWSGTVMVVDEADAVFSGDGVGNVQFGQSTTLPGDVSGDGVPDLLIGDDKFWVSSSGAREGAVYLFEGAAL